MRCFVVLLLSFVFAVDAFAGPTEEAREHYQQATAHFAVGEFADAATEYQAAFKAKPDPALLYDAAQSYRLANNPEKALILYRNYLQLYPNQSNADEVRTQIEKLKEAITATDKAKNAPPTGTTEPTRIAPSTTPEATATKPSPPQQAQATPANTASVAGTTDRAATAERTKTPLYKKWWLWTAVGVVVAGGVVTAAVLATQPHGSWSNVSDIGPGSQNGLTMAVRW